MRSARLSIFTSLCASLSFGSPKPNLIIDHDAGVDDLASIAIAILSNKFHLRAITICPADSFKAPAVQTTLALLKFLGEKNIEVAAGDNEGINHFPEKWRADSLKLAQIEELNLPQTEYAKFGYSLTPAPDKLVELLGRGEKYQLIVTGPLSNVADALRIKPEVAKNIDKIYFMGGAFKVQGNVVVDKAKPVAEWNVYNNPSALETVLKAQVPIVFISLDATNTVPVTHGFMQKLNDQKSHRVSALFYKIWSVVAPQISAKDYQKTYFFWDTLTSAVASGMRSGRLEEEMVRVVVDGVSQGQTMIEKSGTPAMLFADPSQASVESFILDVLKK